MRSSGVQPDYAAEHEAAIDPEDLRLDPVELGHKGGRAGAKAQKATRGSFKAAVRGLLERDPGRYAAQLLDSSCS